MSAFKFRSWDGKKMHLNVIPFQWDFVIDRSHWRVDRHHGNGHPEFIIEGMPYKIIMEYSDVPDMEGNEVCEDDLLKEDNMRGLVFRVLRVPGGLVALDTQLSVADADAFGEPLACPHTRYYISHSCKIIGNIHQNPTLAEVKTQ